MKKMLVPAMLVPSILVPLLLALSGCGGEGSDTVASVKQAQVNERKAPVALVWGEGKWGEATWN